MIIDFILSLLTCYYIGRLCFSVYYIVHSRQFNITLSKVKIEFKKIVNHLFPKKTVYSEFNSKLYDLMGHIVFNLWKTNSISYGYIQLSIFMKILYCHLITHDKTFIINTVKHLPKYQEYIEKKDMTLFTKYNIIDEIFDRTIEQYEAVRFLEDSELLWFYLDKLSNAAKEYKDSPAYNIDTSNIVHNSD